MNSKKSNIQYFIMSLPSIIYFTVFCYLPFAGLVLAFKKYSFATGLFGGEWVWFDNFKFFFVTDAFTIVRNTLLYGITFIITNLICAVFVALMLYEVRHRALVKVYQTLYLLPNFISWIVVSYIAYTMLSPVHGVLNNLMESLNMTPVQWYNKPHYWPFIITIFNNWKLVGINCIVYYAALMSIDSELFEAAKIDGANRFRQIIHISIPHLTPIMTMLSILALGNIFKGDFSLFYSLPRNVGALYETTDIIDTFVYRALRVGNISMGTAVGLMQSVVGLAAVLIANTVIKKISPENSLF